MYKLSPRYVCQDCDMDFTHPQYSIRYEPECPYCGSNLLEEWYTCPGCGREKLEVDFPTMDIDLCTACLEKEIEAIKNDTPARRQIIQFLKECS